MCSTWYIYHVQNCTHAKPLPKNKYVAIVCKDLKFMGFLINTEIRPYVKNRPHLLICQAVIEKSNHHCLSRDSYVDCTTLYPFEDSDLLERHDNISKQAKAEIQKAVTNSKTIEKRYRELILGE